MRAKEKFLWIIVVLTATIFIVSSVHNRFAFAGSRPAAKDPAPDFTLSDLNGKKVHLSDFKGEVVLINFFASWCPPCKMEVPGFQKVYTTYKEKGFAVVGIATDSVPSSFITSLGVTYPVLEGTEGVFDDYGNISSIPVSFLIGRDGKILKKVMGLYPEYSVQSDVELALKVKK